MAAVNVAREPSLWSDWLERSLSPHRFPNEASQSASRTSDGATLLRRTIIWRGISTLW